MNKTAEELNQAEKMAKRYGVRMCDENGDTHGEELYCVGIDDIADIIREARAEPVCKRCNGTKLVSDGECVKDCPDCAEPVKQKHERKCNYNGGTCERRGCISGCQADQLCSINNDLQFELEKTEPVNTRSTSEHSELMKQEPVAYELGEVRRIAAEYKEPNSQIDSGNLYWALCEALQCIDLTNRVKLEPPCWCRICRPITLEDSRMILCPDCGNKRCPKATDHRLACTNSNDPGQPGSAY